MNSPLPLQQIILGFFLVSSLTGCMPGGVSARTADGLPSGTELPQQPAVKTAGDDLSVQYLWLDPAIPQSFLTSWRVPEGWEETAELAKADAKLAIYADLQPSPAVCRDWTLALTAPFPTVLDSVGMKSVRNFWQSAKTTVDFPVSTLLVDEEIENMLKAIWGEANPASPVQIMAQQDQVDFAWQKENVFALVPFDQLDPRWKVIQLGGRSPLKRDLAKDYPLNFKICLSMVNSQTVPSEFNLPSGNRDEDKMTIVALTGTTAPVRGTAYQMEMEGLTFPAEKLAGLLSQADITHISNEVPLYEACPPAVPLRREARFCGKPAYLELFQKIGVDVIELTGNHVMDWGSDAFLETLDLYERENVPYYGGGKDATQAAIPWKISDHGNRLVFLGCNSVGPEAAWAKKDAPGARKCDFDELALEIASYKSEGYLPIVTLQDFEYELIPPASIQRANFRAAALAGAVLVSGSQAHNAQGFRFYDQTLVHYGLGNLFFDQTFKNNRPALIDMHVFYDQRFLGTELITITMPDSLQPQLMTQREREKFLTKVFAESEWK